MPRETGSHTLASRVRKCPGARLRKRHTIPINTHPRTTVRGSPESRNSERQGDALGLERPSCGLANWGAIPRGPRSKRIPVHSSVSTANRGGFNELLTKSHTNPAGFCSDGAEQQRITTTGNIHKPADLRYLLIPLTGGLLNTTCVHRYAARLFHSAKP